MKRNYPMDNIPKLTVYGTTCFWWDDIENAGSMKGIPCCPKCHGVLFQTLTSQWLKGAEAHEAKEPGYFQLLKWSKGKCFKSKAEAREAFEKFNA